MQEAKQQHVGRAVNVEVVQHGVDPLDRGIDPGLDLAQKVDPVNGGAALVGEGEGGAARRLQGAKDIAGSAAPAVIDLLPGTLRLGSGRLDEPLARIALGRLRAHLVQADYDAAGWCCGVELLDRPLTWASGRQAPPYQSSPASLLILDPARARSHHAAWTTAASPHIRSGARRPHHDPSCLRASGSGGRDHPF